MAISRDVPPRSAVQLHQETQPGGDGEGREH